MHEYLELKRIIIELEDDASEYFHKNNQSAGVRFRVKLSEIRERIKDLRRIIAENRRSR